MRELHPGLDGSGYLENRDGDEREPQSTMGSAQELANAQDRSISREK